VAHGQDDRDERREQRRGERLQPPRERGVGQAARDQERLSQ
jgi:hypothetical protein